MTAKSVGARHARRLALSLARTGASLGVAGLLLLGANKSLQNAAAEGDTRTLSFHHVHTGEDITITFKHDGRYDDEALKKLDWFMRDWRKEQETHMDPHLFDLLWETYRAVGAKQPIDVICGYRSPGTNAMLRARSRAVAQFSQHINGNAIDFYIPGVPLSTVRAEGLRLQRGGVGFYPTSGSPFVHMDTGTIRHWPRIPRQELVKIFPDGRTVHIPADGHPLPGYAVALADVERHGAVPSGTSLEAARAAGVITASQEQIAVAATPDENAAVRRPRRSLLATIFGGDEQDEQVKQPAPKHAPVAVASLSSHKTVVTEPIVPLPAARPNSVLVASILPRPRPAEPKMTTASISAKAFDDRGSWQAAAEPGPALPAQIAAGTRYEMASAEAVRVDDNALAYANEQAAPLAARARPMGSRLPQMPAEARVIPASTNSTMVVKPPVASAMGGDGQVSDSPWLRAAMLTPSVRYMTASRVGALDPRWLQDLLHKPAQSLSMSFSADPHLGVVADRFSGSAVVFLATTTFVPAQATASLR